MRLDARSEEDTLEFDHMKKPVCESKKNCACMSISVNPNALTMHMAHSLTHSPRHGHAATGNLSLLTAGKELRAIVT